MEIRLRTVRKEYGVLHRQVEQTVLGLVANRLKDRTAEALGPRYASAPRSLDRVDSGTTALREQYSVFQQQYKQPDVQVEQTLRRYDARETAIRTAVAQSAEPTSAGTMGEGKSEDESPSDVGRKSNEAGIADERPLEIEPPTGTSYAQIREAQSGVRRFAEKVKPELIQFLSRPAGREIALHVPALMKTNAVAEVVLGHVSETYPILKPFFKILTSALSDATSKGLGEKIDEFTSSIAKNPGSAENGLADLAKEMADSVPITVSPVERNDVVRAAASLESEASRTDGLRASLNVRAKAIEAARIDQLFTNLESNNPDVRQTAAEELSRKGKSLDREQADRLMKMVRSEGHYVQTRSWRGEHCTHYERKALKYYAGLAVEKMDSPYVTDAVRREAAVAQTEEGGGVQFERDDDAGWI